MQIKFAPKMNKKITKTIKSDIKTTTLFDKKCPVQHAQSQFVNEMKSKPFKNNDCH